jgi:hypothetical protein
MDWTVRHLFVASVVFIRRQARRSRSCSVDTPPPFSREQGVVALSLDVPGEMLQPFQLAFPERLVESIPISILNCPKIVPAQSIQRENNRGLV